jgi:ribonuclease Z
MALSLTVLGTGNPIPDPDRAGAAVLVQAGGTRLLVDAGRGVTMRLAAAGVLPVMLDAVLVTHLHSDHVCDLNDVITTHWVMSQAPTALPVHGPPRTGEVVAGCLAMLAPDIEHRLAHHADLAWRPQVEVHELEAPCSLTIGEAAVEVRATDHRPVEPTVGYRISHGGRSVALAGDSVPCAGLDELCADADVYVQTVVRQDLVRRIPSPRFHDVLDYHSTVEQAADTAARCRVRTLVLTHLVPAPPPGTADGWAALARARFDGEVVVADDLTAIPVPT